MLSWWAGDRVAAEREHVVRTKDYWKGKPKLQAWFKSRADAEALRAHFQAAKAAGRTFARAPGGWVTEWVVPAASAAARGQFPGMAPENEEYRQALALVADAYVVSDMDELERRLVVLTARALRAGRDPFGLRVAFPEVAEG